MIFYIRVYIRQFILGFTCGIIYSVVFGKCTVSDIYPLLNYHTEQFHWPKILCVPPNLSNHWLFFLFFPFFAFSSMSQSWNHTVCSMQPFQIGCFYLVIYIQCSSMSFHGLIAHFFLALGYIPLSTCLHHSLFIQSPTEGHLDCS